MRAIVLLVVLSLLVFILSCRLEVATMNTGTGPSVSLAARALLGDGRSALALHFYETADRFFHRGVPHVRERALGGGWFDRARQAIAPEAHVHTDGYETAEILPWLSLALRMDPHNIEIALVSAYWLTHELNQPETAYQVLLQSQAKNPYRYELPLERARLLLTMGRPEAAARTFDAALRFWEHAADREDEQAQLDRNLMVLYRGLLHEVEGNVSRAVDVYREALAFSPAPGLQERLARLEAGEAPEVPPEALLIRFHREVDASRHPECDHDQHDHDHHRRHSH